jgi:hypothetical protein
MWDKARQIFAGNDKPEKLIFLFNIRFPLLKDLKSRNYFVLFS